MSTLIRLDGITFAYGRTTIIEDFSLEVDDGEFLAIMGPSGSGKSTLLALMAGLKTPQSGRVVFEGKDIATFSEQQRARYLNQEIGMIYQFFNLIPDISALDNAAMPALISGLKTTEARQKAAQLLVDVGLEKKQKSKAAKLSGGQQQRVAIARAFINGPKVIFADEPTGNLDRASTEAVMDMLCQERERQGTALVVVTHDKDVASRADSILEL